MKNQQRKFWCPFIFAVFILITLLIVNCSLLIAAIPPIMTYQGKVTDTLGLGINDTLDIGISIWTAEDGGDSLWSETHFNVPIIKGLFDVHLGIDDSIFLPFNKDYWLQIMVDGDKLLPRTKLTTSPYAFRAMYADSVAGSGDNDWTRDWNHLYTYNITDSVGIGIINPKYKLHVEDSVDGIAAISGDAVGYFRNTSSSLNNYAAAVYAENISSVDYGYGGVFKGQYVGAYGGVVHTGVLDYYGLYGYVERDLETDPSGLNYGVYGNAVNGIDNYGVFGIGTGSGTNYGVYGTAAGGAVNWAGYFDNGNVYIANNIGIGTETPEHVLHVEGVEDTSVLLGGAVGFFKNNSTSITLPPGGVYGECANIDGAGHGGYFIGGSVGVQGAVNASGSGIYHGVLGSASGGGGSNYGVKGVATGSNSSYAVQGWAHGTGTNYAIYGNATDGVTNYAGYFEDGDVCIENNLSIGFVNTTWKLDVNGDMRADDYFEFTEDYTGDAISILKKVKTQKSISASEWQPVVHTSWPDEVIVETIQAGTCKEQNLPDCAECIDLENNKCKVYNRSLGGVSSINTRAIRQLIERVERLEEENAELKQRLRSLEIQ
ncbi:hypothetical protein JXI42_01120 [bacterium]|nr:hypothetical protein [bacterium]